MRVGRLSLIVLLVAIGVVVGFLKHSQSPQLEVLGVVPSFSLIKADGSEFNSSQMKDKVWVIDFFFTSCDGPCPLITSRIADLAKDPALSQVHFVSITVDPEHDSRPVLTDYAKRFQADPLRWFFLTGQRSDIRALIGPGLHLAASDDVSLHNTRLTLVDRSGQIRGFYQGTDPESFVTLRSDLLALLE